MASCPFPSNIMTFFIDNDSAVAYWPPINGATSYDIRYRPIAKPSLNWQTVSIVSFVYQFDDLNPGTQYEYQIRTICNNINVSDYSPSVTFLTSPICLEPDNVQILNLTTTGFTVYWSPVLGAISYTIQWRPSFETIWTSSASTSVNQYNVANLLPDTTYYIRVRAVCQDQPQNSTSIYSSPITITTQDNCPEIVDTTLAAAAIDSDSAFISWTPAYGPNIVGYEVMIRIAGQPQFETLNTTASNIVIDNLSPNTNYEFQVNTLCLNSQRSQSTTLRAFTTTAACVPPTGLAVNSVQSTSFTVTWFDSGLGATYNVEVSNLPFNNVGWSVANVVLALNHLTTPVAVVSGLTSSTTYYVRSQMSNCNGGQTSDWSIGATGQTNPPPTAGTSGTGLAVTTGIPCSPTTLAFQPVSNITDTSATLTFNTVPGSLAYRVYHKSILGATWQFWDSVSHSSNPTITTVVGGLTPNTSTQLAVTRVCGTNPLSESNFTISPTFTTLLATQCAIPNGLSILTLAASSATIRWNYSSSAVEYHLEYAINNGSFVPYTVVIQPTTPQNFISVTLANLVPGTTYAVRVRSFCTNGNFSFYSGSVAFTTQVVDCPAPAANTISIISASPTNFAIDFNFVQQAINYQVQVANNSDPNFNTPIVDQTQYGSDAAITGLAPSTQYFLRVRSICQESGPQIASPWTTINIFTAVI